MNKKLEKSSQSKMIDGVCAGIAHYFDIDPTLVRLAFVFIGLLKGCGLLLYIIAAIIMPRSQEF